MNFHNQLTQDKSYSSISNISFQMNPWPQNILSELQICTNNAVPIFIVPNKCVELLNSQRAQMINQTISTVPTCQHNNTPVQLGLHNFPPYSFYNFSKPLFWYLFPIPYIVKKNLQREYNCYQKSTTTKNEEGSSNCFSSDPESAQYKHSSEYDNTIYKKKNCSLAMSLQSLITQLLMIQGVISHTVTRLLFRELSENVTTTVEEFMTQAKKSLSRLTKDQLLIELKNIQKINALISLYMTIKSSFNILSILTFAQLQINALKGQVEIFINQKLMEDQGMGIEIQNPLDKLALSLKTDAELRELLAALRHKEHQQMISLNFAPHRVQRVVAENQVKCMRNKIDQVETEINTRKCREMDVSRQPVLCGKKYFNAFYA